MKLNCGLNQIYQLHLTHSAIKECFTYVLLKYFCYNDKEKSAIMNSDSEDLPHNRYQETCNLPAIEMMAVVLLGCGIIWYLRRLNTMCHHLKTNNKIC